MHSLQRMLLVQNYLSTLRHEYEPEVHMGYPMETKPLFQPSLENIKEALMKGLPSYFETVEVNVVECLDLRQPPFGFPAQGLCGNPTIVEVGGPPYLLPTVQREKVYNFCRLQQVLDINPCFIIGAGAGPFPYVGVNCEGIYSLMISGKSIKQASKIAKVDVTNNKPVVMDLPQNETRYALLANLFVSNGEGGQVLKVHVRKRIGCHDFISSIRNCLRDSFQGEVMGMGGTFIMKTGSFKQHVMPDFSKEPLKSEDDLNTWLQFYNMSAPLVAVGTFVTGDLELDLRLQHFHSFSDHGEAGHYHIDVTPDTVEYIGFFNVAHSVVRVDKPEDTHNMGRD